MDLLTHTKNNNKPLYFLHASPTGWMSVFFTVKKEMC